MSKSSSSMFASINRTSFVTESEKIVKLKGRPALLSKNVNELSQVFRPSGIRLVRTNYLVQSTLDIADG